MMKKKKLLSLFLASAMTLSLAACGEQKEADPAEESSAGDSEKYTIGICQLVAHEALDAATQGFMDALNDALPGQVEFDLQNAAGDSNTCSTITNGFVSAGDDLIMANGTAALLAAATATSDIPVLGTSITEYGVALGISDFSGTVGGNVSGTSDLAPLDRQAAMIPEWVPDAETVGLLYCSAEPNSQYQVDTIQGHLEDLGLTCTQYAFADSNDIASVTENAAANSDVLYLPTDNTVASNTGVIDNICRPKGIPVIAGESGICVGCGVAALSISYYDLGRTTGEMAAQILTGEADISQLPIAYAPEVSPIYNATICDELGLTVPDGYEPLS